MKFYQLVCLLSLTAAFIWIVLITVLNIVDPKIPSTQQSSFLPDNTAVVQAENEPPDNPLAGLEEKQMWKHLGEGVYEFSWHSPATTFVNGDIIWPATLVRFIREHPDLEVTAISETTFGSAKRAIVVTKK